MRIYVCLGFLFYCGSLLGCSFLFVTGPPANHQQLEYFDCTEAVAAPIIDTLMLLSVSSAAVYNSTLESSSQRNAILTGNLIGMALWGSSMISGVRKTSECGDAKKAAYARQASRKSTPAYGASYFNKGTASTAGCTKDTDCKGNRICSSGQCINPNDVHVLNEAKPMVSCTKNMDCMDSKLCYSGQCRTLDDVSHMLSSDTTKNNESPVKVEASPE